MASIDPPPAEQTISVPFKAKLFDYNRYRIEFNDIKGILNLANVVIDVVEPPSNYVLPNPLNETYVGVRFAPIMSFTNQGNKVDSPALEPTENISDLKTVDITPYIQEEEKQEHWNEYVLAREPLELLKTKTTLMKIVLNKDRSDGIGNPLFHVNHTTNHVVSEYSAPEAGRR